MKLKIECKKCGNDLETQEIRKVREDVEMMWIVKMSCPKCNDTIFARAEIQVF